MICKTTTTIHLIAFIQVGPGEPIPEETFTHSLRSAEIKEKCVLHFSFKTRAVQPVATCHQ